MKNDMLWVGGPLDGETTLGLERYREKGGAYVLTADQKFVAIYKFLIDEYGRPIMRFLRKKPYVGER